MKVIFSHGKESGPWGGKITKLANIAKELNFSVDSIDYTDTFSPDERVVILNKYLENETQPFILVGSSMGVMFHSFQQKPIAHLLYFY
jgi:hypothetical protein